MFKKLLCVVAIAGISLPAIAQKIYFEHQPAPQVFEGTKEKVLAWCGGINAPQLGVADLNNDGKKDLVVYESGYYYTVRTFINIGTPGNQQYRYEPGYALNFPGVNGYIKLVDYDRDGISDLINRGTYGFNVYKGYFDSQNKLAFNYYRPMLYKITPNAQYPDGWKPTYCSTTDIPEITDIDGDGDLDAVSFNELGAVINYYRNCQVEELLDEDSIRICLKDECWGKTYQNIPRQHDLGIVCNNFNVTCKGCPQNEGEERVTHIGGNVLALMDYDGDGDMDYMTSNVAYPDVQFFKNGKVEYQLSIDSMIAQDTIWDANGKAVSISSWAAPAALDIDDDNDVDLVFSSHATGTENYKSVWLYKNDGSYNYNYVSDSFLVEDMIDAGSGSYPLFYDFNKDGLKDLLLGSDGVFHTPSGTNRASISYFENTGTATQPKFTMQTRNLMGIATADYRGAAIAVGDLDNDGKDDLVLGHTDGTLSYYKNTAAFNTVAPVWSLWQSIMKDKDGGTIDVLGYATPCIYDINKDGKPDLIIGSKLGYIAYYENKSTSAGTYTIELVTQTLGDMKGGPSNSDGYSAPYIGRIDNTNTDYIMLGTVDGEINRFDGFQSGNTSGSYTRIDSVYSDIDVCKRSAPAFADLDGDGKYEMVLGTETGGLHFFKQYFNVGVEELAKNEVNNIRIYPNPAGNKVNISWQQDGGNAVRIRIVSVTGQELMQYQAIMSSSSASLDIAALPVGMYYCIVSGGNSQIAKPLAIIR
jgi:FG-GAP repeat.